MSISIQQFLLSEGSKNSRLLKKSILLSRRSDEREKVINEKLNKINAQNVVPQKDPQTEKQRLSLIDRHRRHRQYPFERTSVESMVASKATRATH